MNEINIKLNTKQVAEAISLTFTGKYKDEMTECLMSVLEGNDVGLASLYKASIGVKPELEYTIGTRVYVEIGTLSTWRMALKEMKKTKAIIDDLLVCTIIKVDKYAENPYKVEYDYLDVDKAKDTLTNFSYINPIFIKDSVKETLLNNKEMLPLSGKLKI
jgi:hypothetical protein